MILRTGIGWVLGDRSSAIKDRFAELERCRDVFGILDLQGTALSTGTGSARDGNRVLGRPRCAIRVRQRPCCCDNVSLVAHMV